MPAKTILWNSIREKYVVKKFRSARHIQEYLKGRYNLHPTVDFIKMWCKNNFRPVTGDWYEGDLVQMGKLGDERISLDENNRDGGNM